MSEVTGNWVGKGHDAASIVIRTPRLKRAANRYVSALYNLSEAIYQVGRKDAENPVRLKRAGLRRAHDFAAAVENLDKAEAEITGRRGGITGLDMLGLDAVYRATNPVIKQTLTPEKLALIGIDIKDAAQSAPQLQ